MDRLDRARWNRDRFRGHGGLLGGIILAGIGVLLLLQNLGIPYFDDLERYWPLILIAVGVAQAARSVGMGGRVWGAALFLAGTILMLNNLGIIHGDVWRFIWPGIIIMVGLAMLAKSIDRNMYGPPAGTDPKAMGENIKDRIRSEFRAGGWSGSPNHMSEWAIFGGSRRRIDSQDFQGGEAFAMFGGVEIDLRKSGAAGDILIEANAIFGGVEIRGPETWDVTVRGSGIFGGYEDKTLDSRGAPDAKAPHLIVNGFAVFGGVTVQN